MEPIHLADHSRPCLVCFSHLRWNFVYQRPQHLISRAAKTYQVFFIEEPLFETVEEPFLRLRNGAPGLIIATPILPPELNLSGMEVQQRLIAGFFQNKPIDVLWFYTPMAQKMATSLKKKLVVYDCMDELSAFRGASEDLIAQETELFKQADLVFAGGRSLYEAKKRNHPESHLFPSSIDKAHFGKARQVLDREPEDQAGIPHPRLGFFGVIDERFDSDLLAAMADLKPEWQFVMIGPVVKIDPQELPRRNNIHWLGSKDYQDLPRYLCGWDIGLMPFALNEATRFISPTKTPEFLAAGIPVVSTPITDVVSPYGEKNLVAIASDATEMMAKAEQLRQMHKAEWLKRVDDFLKDQSWDQTWDRMQKLIQARIAAKRTPISLQKAQSMKLGTPQIVRSSRSYDWLVVGAGFAGSVMAERLASQAGQRVLVIDRRPHIGGNAFDCLDKAGLLIHQYGPHIFHTNSETVFSYLSRFTEWRSYQHRVLAKVDGQLVPIPINLDTINRLYGLSLDSEGVAEFFRNRAEHIKEIRTSEDVVVSQVGRELYEKFFRHYTRKQWGLDPSELDRSVTARIPVRTNRDDRYFGDQFQFMPKRGYTKLFEKMLDHPLISVRLGVDYKQIAKSENFERMVFTGPIDEYFDYCFGKLPYRSLNFDHITIDQEWYQPVAVVNYPQDQSYTRITEYKHLTGQRHSKTSITYEYPNAEGDPYYPIPRPENAERYRRYQNLADRTPEVLFIGRLASYRYYNMDQVVGQALSAFNRLAPSLPRAPKKGIDPLVASSFRKSREAAKP